MIAWAALRKEMIEQWRTYRLLVVCVVLIAMAMTSPLIAKLTPELLKLLPGGADFASLVPAPTLMDAVGQYVKNISQFAFLLALLTSMGLVAQEKEKGTAVLMLVKPLGRGTFLFSKFAAQAVTFLVALLLAGLAGYYYTMFLFSAPDLTSWLVMNLLLWLWIMVYVAVTLLGSTLLKSQAAAAASGFGFLLVVAFLGSLPGIGLYLPGQLTASALAIFRGASADLWPAVLVSLGLIVACLLAAWASFSRQEL